MIDEKMSERLVRLLACVPSDKNNEENDMKYRGYVPGLAAALLLSAPMALAQSNQTILPTNQNGTVAPDDWLIGKGRAWFYHGAPSVNPVEIHRREPTDNEKPVVDKARALFASRPAKVMALIDGHDVVYQEAKAPITDDSYLFSFSMGKTITSMAVGKAICAGKLTLATRADEIIPELRGKDLGGLRPSLIS